MQGPDLLAMNPKAWALLLEDMHAEDLRNARRLAARGPKPGRDVQRQFPGLQGEPKAKKKAQRAARKASRRAKR